MRRVEALSLLRLPRDLALLALSMAETQNVTRSCR
jgi:hypothetical protein